jgi:hypothetical protein
MLDNLEEELNKAWDEIDASIAKADDLIALKISMGSHHDDICPVCGCEESGCDEIGCRSDDWEDGE